MSVKSSKKRKRKQKRGAARRRPTDRGERVVAGALSGMRSSSVEITWEPLDDGAMKSVAPRDRERIHQISKEIMYGGGAAEYLDELEALAERYPDLPKVRNLLTGAADAAGDDARVEQMIREDVERFPDYLFAVTTYARLCLREKRLDEAMRLFEGRMCLADFHPNRRRFHVVELMALHGVLTELFARRGDLDQAEMQVGIIEAFEPEHPETRRLKDVIAVCRIRQAARKLIGMSGGSGRPKRAARRAAPPAVAG